MGRRTTSPAHNAAQISTGCSTILGAWYHQPRPVPCPKSIIIWFTLAGQTQSA